MQQSGLTFQFASVTLRADWGVVYTAVLQDEGALEFASEALRADPEFLIAVGGDLDDYLGLIFAPLELAADPDVALAALRRNGRSHFNEGG